MKRKPVNDNPNRSMVPFCLKKPGLLFKQEYSQDRGVPKDAEHRRPGMPLLQHSGSEFTTEQSFDPMHMLSLEVIL